MSDLRLSGVRYELTRTLLHDLDLTFAAGRIPGGFWPSFSALRCSAARHALKFLYDVCRNSLF